MIWLKQLFCEHIWKDIEAEYLKTVVTAIGSTVIRETQYYAITRRCIKCSKSKIDEVKAI